jgi:hypothetical protein
VAIEIRIAHAVTQVVPPRRTHAKRKALVPIFVSPDRQLPMLLGHRIYSDKQPVDTAPGNFKARRYPPCATLSSSGRDAQRASHLPFPHCGQRRGCSY